MCVCVCVCVCVYPILWILTPYHNQLYDLQISSPIQEVALLLFHFDGGFLYCLEAL